MMNECLIMSLWALLSLWSVVGMYCVAAWVCLPPSAHWSASQ